MIFPRARTQCVCLARPGLIVFTAVAVVAIALVVVLLLPAPGLKSKIRKLVPSQASIQSQVESQTAAAVYCTTSESLTNVADFFRKRLKLGRRVIIGSGISMSSESGLFGRRSSAVLPYGKEGFAVVVREQHELVAIAVSRGLKEKTTHIEIFAERINAFGLFPTNAALSYMPPNGQHDSSTRGPGVDAAIFSTPAQFREAAEAYHAKLRFSPEALGSAHSTLFVTPAGILSRPKRDGADSVTFLATAGTNASIFVHGFQSAGSTQTHALASHVYK